MSEVLALKYRPTSFDKLIGQESVSQTLSLALDSHRLSHAYLFSGLRGSGKTSTARIFAKSLLCDRGPTSMPCGECENCLASSGGTHIDIIEIDGASNRKIDDIRGLIEQTKYRPNMGRFKIFIIDEVHMLTKEAFNALLKTLEEPPEYIKFLLATTDPLKLPVTILSRTQHFRFKKIKKDDIIHHLIHILNQEGVEYEYEALDILARIGAGSLRDTLTMLEQAIVFSKGKIDSKSVASMYGMMDPDLIEEIFRVIFEKDRDEILKIIQEIEDYDPEIVVEELITYAKEKFFAKDIRFSPMVSERFFKILSESKELLFINADSGFLFTLIFFKMIEALNIKSVDEMINELENQILLPKEKVKPTLPKQEIELKKEDTTPITTSQNNNKEQFNRLIAKIYDRNYELGECFEKSIEFKSYENNTISWISCANDECKSKLKHSYSIIKHFIQEIFGIDTKIKMLPCDKTTPLDIEMKKEEESANSSSSSMIEEIENQGSSCISNRLGLNNTKEYDAKEIVNSEFVQKAIDMLDIKKVRVKSKV